MGKKSTNLNKSPTDHKFIRQHEHMLLSFEKSQNLARWTFQQGSGAVTAAELEAVAAAGVTATGTPGP